MDDIRIEGLDERIAGLYSKHLSDYKTLLHDEEKSKELWGEKPRKEFLEEWRLGLGIYTLPKKKEFMFIMQNPGLSLKKKSGEIRWENNEKENIKDICEKDKNNIVSQKVIGEYCKGLKDWLKGKNKTFSETFFGEIVKLIEPEFSGEWKSYINSRFLSRFHVTDMIKFRMYTTKFGKGLDKIDKGILENARALLKEEIKIVKPKIIFAFSTRTLGELQKIKIFNVKFFCSKDERIREYVEKNSEIKISKVHGAVFNLSIDDFKTKLIPLSHFSGQAAMHHLRNSYFDYLKGDLEYYKNSV